MAIDDKLAEWLGLWKPSQACEQDSDIPISYPCHRIDPNGPRHWQREPGHHIPAPDLASDALYKAIIEGLKKHDLEVHFRLATVVIYYHRTAYEGDREIDTDCTFYEYAVGPTLLDAARAAWLREQEQK